MDLRKRNLHLFNTFGPVGERVCDDGHNSKLFPRWGRKQKGCQPFRQETDIVPKPLIDQHQKGTEDFSCLN